MNLSYELTRQDLEVAKAAACAHMRSLVRGRNRLMLVNVLTWIPVGVAFAMAFRVLESAPWLQSRLLTIGGLLGLAFVGHLVYSNMNVRMAHTVEMAEFEPLPMTQELTVADDALRFSSRLGAGSLPWTTIVLVRELGDHVALILRPASAIVVPNRAFASAEQRESFVAALRERIRPHTATHAG